MRGIAQTQGRNIRHYAAYLAERARAYRDTKVDWVRTKETRLEKLSVDKGLLRETEVIQHQLTALLKCDVSGWKQGEGFAADMTAQVLDEPENEITITVFRLLVLDLLSLFQVLNQAMINILGHFFEMSKPDAERAMEIYRTFTRHTDFVVQYLQIARQYEHHTRVEVPKLKHAPVNLGRQLEDYLKDADFEVHRRQYLAELDIQGAGGVSSKNKKGDAAAAAAKLFPDTNTNGGFAAAASKPAPTTKGPAPDLIDFFDSIEQNQQPMAVETQQPQEIAQQQQMAQHQLMTQPNVGNPWATNSPFDNVPRQTAQPFQNNGFAPQATGFASNSPFQQQQQNVGVFNAPQQQLPPQQQLQPSFTGAGFGGYTPQQSFSPSNLSSIPQDSVASFQTGTLSPPMQTGLQPGQQTTNPFRQSMLMASPTGLSGQPPAFGNTTSPPPASQLQRQPTNPFARSSPNQFGNPVSNQAFQPQQLQQGSAAQPLQPMQTGTNPFAKNFAGGAAQQQQRPQTSGALMPQPTGSTNPFRQGDFVNHQTGLGWQHNQARIGGGFDEIQTTPVFPRPSTSTAWQT